MFEKLNIKLLIVSFVAGMIFSVIIGGISKVPFWPLLLRSVITGIVVLICVYGITLVINKFLPELIAENSSDSFDTSEIEQNPIGQNIDIVMDDTPETASTETQFDHQAVQSANVSESINNTSAAVDNQQSTSTSPENNNPIDPVEPASIDNAIRKGEAPLASSGANDLPGGEFKAQSLPDIGALADNMGNLSVSAEEVEEEKMTSRPRSSAPLGNGDGMVDTVRKNDSEDMAKAIRTVIKREEG